MLGVCRFNPPTLHYHPPPQEKKWPAYFGSPGDIPTNSCVRAVFSTCARPSLRGSLCVRRKVTACICACVFEMRTPLYKVSACPRQAPPPIQGQHLTPGSPSLPSHSFYVQKSRARKLSGQVSRVRITAVGEHAPIATSPLATTRFTYSDVTSFLFPNSRPQTRGVAARCR